MIVKTDHLNATNRPSEILEFWPSNWDLLVLFQKWFLFVGGEGACTDYYAISLNIKFVLLWNSD